MAMRLLVLIVFFEIIQKKVFGILSKQMIFHVAEEFVIFEAAGRNVNKCML